MYLTASTASTTILEKKSPFLRQRLKTTTDLNNSPEEESTIPTVKVTCVHLPPPAFHITLRHGKAGKAAAVPAVSLQQDQFALA